MGRPKFDARISLKRRGKKTVRIDLRRLLDGSWQIFANGKRSKKLPHGTSTDIANKIRQWLKA